MKYPDQKNVPHLPIDRNSRLKFKALVFLGLLVMVVWTLKAFAQAQPAAAALPGNAAGPNGAAAAAAKEGPACLPVEGLTFTISGPETLLATRGTESVALIHTTMFLPAGLHELRFLASELCPGGPKAHFVVNHYLHTVQQLRLFDGPSNEYVAVINPTGRSGTVRGPSAQR
jgi:hypothetical protein